MDDPGDFTVEVTYDDGSTEEIYEGFEIASKTLKAGKTAKVKITYEGLKTVVKIKGEKVLTMGERNALDKAQEYLEVLHFSKKGLKEQLQYEGFSSDQIDYAIKKVYN